MHVTSWESISKKKQLGGWDIKNIKWFNIALVLKTIWIGLSGNGPWGEILRAKYLWRKSLVDWIINYPNNIVGGSIVWRGFVKHFYWIGQLVAWNIGNVRLVCVGIDPFIGGEHSYLLPNLMVCYLNSLSIHTLDQCFWIQSVFGGSIVWISAWNLGLSSF